MRVARSSTVGVEATTPATDRLLAELYAELREIARAVLRRAAGSDGISATTLVHEAWFKLSDQRRANYHDRTHFLAVASIVIRRLLVDHARHAKAKKRGSGGKPVTLHTAALADAPATVDVLLLNEALDRLRVLDERQCRIVELRFFGGLEVAEVAAIVGVSERTVKGDWRMARAWLRRNLTLGATA